LRDGALERERRRVLASVDRVERGPCLGGLVAVDLDLGELAELSEAPHQRLEVRAVREPPRELAYCSMITATRPVRHDCGPGCGATDATDGPRAEA
jgi:hypothetical protein